jgi:hypothetical protein
MICRTIDEVRAAALAEVKDRPPMSQDAADLAAAILATSTKEK